MQDVLPVTCNPMQGLPPFRTSLSPGAILTAASKSYAEIHLAEAGSSGERINSFTYFILLKYYLEIIT